MCSGSELCGMDYVQLCALVHTGCTRQDRFFGDTDGETDGELVDCNRRARVVFEDRDWGGISAEAKRLITRMLDSNPETRITPDEALSSEWFRESEIPTEAYPEGGSCAVS